MTRKPGLRIAVVAGGAAGVVLTLLTTAAAAATGSRDVDARRFPRVARILLLPDEAALLNGLRDDKDRAEFQRIFWTRRDPTPGTAGNEFQDNVAAVWDRADQLFSYPGQKGSETGCGQVLALLGLPEEVVGKGDAIRRPTSGLPFRGGKESPPAAGPGRAFDNMAYLREGSTREPETWVYRDRPGLPYHFTGAELRIDFDSECRYAEAAGFVGEDLRKAAAAFVTHPEIAYSRGNDGHLLPLAATAVASTGASAAARALLATPRADFALSAEPKLVMRAPRGEAYVAGLVFASASTAPASVSIAVEAKSADGQPAGSAAREAAAAAQSDGSWLASWGLTLKPGRYTITLAALTPDARGSTARVEVEVPDFSGSRLAASPLVLFPDEPPSPASADGRGPFAAFQMGGQQLRPRYGNVFTSKDALMVVATVYGGKVDTAGGRAALRSRYSILRDGKPVARGAEDAFTTADAVASVGPIALAGYAPGRYVVRLDVSDGVAQQTLRQEAEFEIR
jgi:GWxTD domain-containing protein